MTQERWFAPIVITASNNGFVVTEDPGGAATQYAVTVAAGTYFSFHGSSAIGNSSLFWAIRVALQGAGAANYTFAPGDPTESTAQTDAGITITSDSGALFKIDFQDAAFTMDNRWFGFGSAELDQTSSIGGLISKYTALSQWVSWTLTGGASTDKRSYLMREIEESSARTADAYQVEWNEDRIRTMRYQYVPAAHVWLNRVDAADAAAYYATGELDVLDNHNAFETIWDSASRLADILVQFDDVSTLDVVNGSYALCRFNERNERKSLYNCVNMTTTQGEFYEISVDLLQTAGNFDY